MNKQFSKLALIVAAIAMTSTAVMAEQTIGVQPVATTATARARVNVSVIVPKIVILRVGVNDASISNVDFTVGPNPAVGSAPGNNLAYDLGAIAPVFATTVATTFPTTTAGVLDTGAWTNAPAGAQLTCTLSAHPTIATGFAVGPTTAGVPGTDNITVVGTTLAHPGSNLTACTSAATSAIASLSVLTGTFTYATNFTASSIAAGSYGNTVTYTATTL